MQLKDCHFELFFVRNLVLRQQKISPVVEMTENSCPQMNTDKRGYKPCYKPETGLVTVKIIK